MRVLASCCNVLTFYGNFDSHCMAMLFIVPSTVSSFNYCCFFLCHYPNRSQHGQRFIIVIVTPESMFHDTDAFCRAQSEVNVSIFLLLLVRRCLQMLPPRYGSILGGSCNNTYLSNCSFSCEQGRELRGDQTRTCTVQANDTMDWSGTPVECDGRLY